MVDGSGAGVGDDGVVKDVVLEAQSAVGVDGGGEFAAVKEVVAEAM